MEDEEINQNQQFALIFGGATPLGARYIADLKTNGWWIASVDYAANSHADINILLLKQEHATKHESNIISSLRSILQSRRLNLILCSTDIYSQSAFEENLINISIDMFQTYVVPAIICQKLANLFLKNNGILIFTCNNITITNASTQDQIAYSMAVSSLKDLTRSIGNGLPSESTIICLMAEYVDTVKMRSMNEHIHPGSFTPLKYLSQLIISWGDRKNLPETGSFCILITEDYITRIVYQDVHK